MLESSRSAKTRNSNKQCDTTTEGSKSDSSGDDLSSDDSLIKTKKQKLTNRKKKKIGSLNEDVSETSSVSNDSRKLVIDPNYLSDNDQFFRFNTIESSANALQSPIQNDPLMESTKDKGVRIN